MLIVAIDADTFHSDNDWKLNFHVLYRSFVTWIALAIYFVCLKSFRRKHREHVVCIEDIASCEKQVESSVPLISHVDTHTLFTLNQMKNMVME